ncbi:hypothetical protein FDP41_007123 [Naegleria fowleri]|uniref:Protein kinase domain-containing protein n=1 Tax=Naegleria fowleri TaxID=5763 RepID=A0A6A5BGF7_NAEFO|nr:uncharacterized protein FDP41_007123 [Naegleria fowleri]KAF0973736.1 hypothetical protein FDP41_007123 [Naegleria fowleri]
MKSMIVGQDCTNMGARYQCLSTDLAINTLNTDLRNKGIEGRDYTTIININFEFIPNPQVTCKSKSFLKSSNIFYRIRFTSYTSNRVSVLCNYMDFNSIFADSQNIISFEIDNLAMTSCRIDHSYSFNMKITNSVIYSTLISLGFDLQGKIIQTDMQYYLNIEGSKFEQAPFYYGNCLLGTISRSSFSGTFKIQNCHQLLLTSSNVVNYWEFVDVKNLNILDISFEQPYAVHITECGVVVIRNCNFASSGYVTAAALTIIFSQHVILDSCNVQTDLTWLITYSVPALYISNIVVQDSVVERGSLVQVYVSQSFELANSTFDSLNGTAFDINDVTVFNAYNISFTNCKSTQDSGIVDVETGYDLSTDKLFMVQIHLALLKFVECITTSASPLNIRSYSKEVMLDNCIFERNIAAIGGGAISYRALHSIFSEPSIKISNSLFQRNTASRGGVFNIKGSVILDSNVFIENNAVRGGIMYLEKDIQQTINILSNNVLSSNTADYGSSIYVDSPMTLSYPFNLSELSSPCFTSKLLNIKSITNNATSKDLTLSAFFPGELLQLSIAAFDIFGNVISQRELPISLKTDKPQYFVSIVHSDQQLFTLDFKILSYQKVNNDSLMLTVTYDNSVLGIPLKVTSCPMFFSWSDTSCVDQSLSYIIILVATVVCVLICILLSGAACACAVAFKKSVVLRNRKKAELEMEQLLIDNRIVFDQEEKQENDHLNNSSRFSTRNSCVIPVEDIKIIKRIGEGGQGVVYHAKWNDIDVAVKTIKVDDDEQDAESDEFEREATMLSSLRHPNILTFYGICVPNKRQKFMVVEYMKGGSLEKLISNCRMGKENIDFKSKINILLGVARGMVYLHSLKPRMIVHRDLKPGNILLDENGAVRVCDFGLSRVVGTNTVQQRTMTTNIGTLLYCAPENFSSDNCSSEMTSSYSQSSVSHLSSLNHQTPYSNSDIFCSSSPSSSLSKEDRFKNASKIDVYSYSIIMWSLFFEENPFSYSKKLYHFSENDNTEEANTHALNILSFVLRGSRPKIPFDNPDQMKEWVTEYMCNKEKCNEVMSNALLEGVSNYIDLMKQCWHQLPRERPSFETIVIELYEIQNILSLRKV